MSILSLLALIIGLVLVSALVLTGLRRFPSGQDAESVEYCSFSTARDVAARVAGCLYLLTVAMKQVS